MPRQKPAAWRTQFGRLLTVSKLAARL
jgi:hypothetical protein